jgi:hypothetical protein
MANTLFSLIKEIFSAPQDVDPILERYFGYVSRMMKATAKATTMATMRGRAAYCARANDLGSNPASIPKPIRTPGLLAVVEKAVSVLPIFNPHPRRRWWAVLLDLWNR